MASAPTFRFNPFQETEVVAIKVFLLFFAGEEGNGVVITSMHTRERTNVFAKPLKKWQSEYELSGEEKEVVKILKSFYEHINKKRNKNLSPRPPIVVVWVILTMVNPLCLIT